MGSLHRFWDIARHLWKIADFNLPNLCLTPQLRAAPSELRQNFWHKKLESLGYPTALLGTILACDRQMNGQVDGHTTTTYTALA